MPDRYSQIMILPTTGAIELLPAERRQIADRGGAWLFVRGTQQTVEAVLGKVLAELQPLYRAQAIHRYGRVTVIELKSVGSAS